MTRRGWKHVTDAEHGQRPHLTTNDHLLGLGALGTAPDGRIFQGRDIAYEGETNTKYPLRDQVQVELMGDFGRQRVSPKQLDSLVKITAWLCAEYSIDPILMGGHNERAPRQTSCPGRAGSFDRPSATSSARIMTRTVSPGRWA